MDICVFCSSSDDVDGRLIEQGERLGRTLAQRHHNLVYGGTPMGTMGALVRGLRAAGGQVVGVAPAFMRDLGITDEECDELVITSDLLDRKREMIARSDGFVALPGGLGTLDELLEVITHIYLGQLTAPVALLDADDFWQPLLAMFDGLVAHRVSQVPPTDMLRVCCTVDKAIDHLEASVSDRVPQIWEP